METLEFEIDEPHMMMYEDLNQGGQLHAALEDHLHDVINEQYTEKNSRVKERQAQMQQAANMQNLAGPTPEEGNGDESEE